MTDGVPRRALLSVTAGAAVTTLTGCMSSDDTDENGGDGGAQSTEGMRLTDIIEIEDHEWRGATLLDVSVRNLLDEELDLVQIEANVYAGDERINHAYTNISSLPPQTVQTSQIEFTQSYGQDPCNADRYELVPNLNYDTEEYQKRMEFDSQPGFCGG
jgi:hypothetical protein